MNVILELIFLFVILIFGLIGTGFVIYTFIMYDRPNFNQDIMFFVVIGAWIPIGALVFSIAMLIDKL